MRTLLLATALCGLAMGAEHATATGQVTDAHGKPVEHATVLVYSAGVKKGYSTYCPTCYADCGKRAASDAEGNFSIAGLSADLIFNLLVVKDGFTPVFINKVNPDDGPAKAAQLAARAPIEDVSRVVRGLVVDPHGRPLRDAVVEQQGIMYKREDGETVNQFGPGNWTDLMTVSNDKGEFEMAYGRPAEKMILSVSARGMAPKLVTEPTGPDRKTVTVTDGALVRGRLMQNGKPVANAEIALMSHNLRAGTAFSEMRIGTNEDGAFAITNIPAGRVFYLYAKMESLKGGVAADVLELMTKDDGQEVNVGDIQLKPGHSVTGRVVLADGKPVPENMRVLITRDRGRDTQTTLLSPDGHFEFKGLSTGVYSIGAAVRGYRVPDGYPDEILADQDLKDVVITLQPVPTRR